MKGIFCFQNPIKDFRISEVKNLKKIINLCNPYKSCRFSIKFIILAIKSNFYDIIKLCPTIGPKFFGTSQTFLVFSKSDFHAFNHSLVWFKIFEWTQKVFVCNNLGSMENEFENFSLFKYVRNDIISLCVGV